MKRLVRKAACRLPRCIAAAACLSFCLPAAAAGGGDDRVLADHPLGSLTFGEFKTMVERKPFDIGEFTVEVGKLARVDYTLDRATAEGIDKDPSFTASLEDAKMKFLANLFLQEHILEPSRPSRKEVEAAFPELYPLPFTYQVITADLDDAAAARDRIAGGEDISDVAREISIGLRADIGGTIGFLALGSGRYSIEEEEVIMSLGEGGISRVVEGPLGYSVFYVEKIKSIAEQQEELFPKIEEKLYTANVAAAKSNMLRQVSDRTKVVINEDFFTASPLPEATSEETEVARVDGRVLTAGAVYFSGKTFHKGIPPGRQIRMREFNNYLKRIFFLIEAERAGLDRDPRFIDHMKRVSRTMLLTFLDSYPDEMLQITEEEMSAAYRAYLEERRDSTKGTTAEEVEIPEEHRRELREHLLGEKREAQRKVLFDVPADAINVHRDILLEAFKEY